MSDWVPITEDWVPAPGMELRIRDSERSNARTYLNVTAADESIVVGHATFCPGAINDYLECGGYETETVPLSLFSHWRWYRHPE